MIVRFFVWSRLPKGKSSRRQFAGAIFLVAGPMRVRNGGLSSNRALGQMEQRWECRRIYLRPSMVRGSGTPAKNFCNAFRNNWLSVVLAANRLIEDLNFRSSG